MSSHKNKRKFNDTFDGGHSPGKFELPQDSPGRRMTRSQVKYAETLDSKSQISQGTEGGSSQIQATQTEILKRSSSGNRKRKHTSSETASFLSTLLIDSPPMGFLYSQVDEQPSPIPVGHIDETTRECSGKKATLRAASKSASDSFAIEPKSGITEKENIQCVLYKTVTTTNQQTPSTPPNEELSIMKDQFEINDNFKSRSEPKSGISSSTLAVPVTSVGGSAEIGSDRINPISQPRRATGLFSTAKGTAVSISDEAFTKADKLLNRSSLIDQTTASSSNIRDRYSNGGPIKPMRLSGNLAKAKGGVVYISETAQRKAKKILATSAANTETGLRSTTTEGVEADYVHPTLGAPEPTSRSQRSALFRTAGGGAVSISADAVARADKILSSFKLQAENKMYGDPTRRGDRIPAGPSSIGINEQDYGLAINSSFAEAASVETLTVSEAANHKAATILSAAATDDAAGPHGAIAAKIEKADTASVFCPTESSIDALATSDNRGNGAPDTNAIRAPSSLPRRVSELFTSARGTRISVSEEAVIRAGKMLLGASNSGASDVKISRAKKDGSEFSIMDLDNQIDNRGGIAVMISEPMPQCKSLHLKPSPAIKEALPSPKPQDIKTIENFHAPDAATEPLRGVNPVGNIKVDFMDQPDQTAPRNDGAIYNLFNEPVYSLSPAFEPQDRKLNFEELKIRIDTIMRLVLLDSYSRTEGTDNIFAIGRRQDGWIKRLDMLLNIDSVNSIRVDFPDTERESEFVINREKKSAELTLSSIPSSQLLQMIFQQLSPVELTPAMKLWVSMQTQWIVWTLASWERRYPHRYLGRLLTQSGVVAAVFRRYGCYVHGTIFDDSRSAHTREARRFSEDRQELGKNRAAEIHVFRWPMVLCLSIDKAKFMRSMDTDPRNDSSKEGADENGGCYIQVSDGWWWTRVRLDSALRGIMSRGLLGDGVKVVAFTGSFEEQNGMTSLSLTYNGVRKASDKAPLGYVRPVHLKRGLSMKTLTCSGGPVFAVSGLLIKITDSFYKLKVRFGKLVPPVSRANSKLSAMDEEDAVALSGDRCRYINLSQSERQEYQLYLDSMQERFTLAQEKNSDLSVRNMIDGVRCEQWVRSLILNLAAGGGEDGMESLGDRQRFQIAKALEELQRKKNDTIKKLLEDQEEFDVVISESLYHKVLLQCAISGLRFWIRFPGEPCSFETGKANGPCPTGESTRNVLYVTNLKFQTVAPGSLPVLVASSSSQMQTSTLSTNVIVQGQSSCAISDLRSIDKFPIELEYEMSALTIISWVVLEDSLVINFLDRTQVMLRLQYPIPCPNVFVKCLKWLVCGGVVTVCGLLLKSYDKKYDVLLCHRTEHTSILLISSSAGGKTARSLSGAAGSLESSRITREEGAIFEKSDIENEKRRMGALEHGRKYYSLSSPWSNVRSCEREYLRGATLYILKSVGKDGEEAGRASCEDCSSSKKTHSDDLAIIIKSGNLWQVASCDRRVVDSAISLSPDFITSKGIPSSGLDSSETNRQVTGGHDEIKSYPLTLGADVLTCVEHGRVVRNLDDADTGISSAVLLGNSNENQNVSAEKTKAASHYDYFIRILYICIIPVVNISQMRLNSGTA